MHEYVKRRRWLIICLPACLHFVHHACAGTTGLTDRIALHANHVHLPLNIYTDRRVAVASFDNHVVWCKVHMHAPVPAPLKAHLGGLRLYLFFRQQKCK